jgi:hypothetical protein
VLQEVQLLVASRLDEIRAVVFLPFALDLTIVANDLVTLLATERWIGEDYVVRTKRGACYPDGAKALAPQL